MRAEKTATMPLMIALQTAAMALTMVTGDGVLVTGTLKAVAVAEVEDLLKKSPMAESTAPMLTV